MSHLVLLGDSIFANSTYIGDSPDVASHVQTLIGSKHQVSLLAIDGSVTADIIEQLRDLPDGATHLFISVGGNDALRQAGFLDESARTTAQVLRRMREIAEQFMDVYELMIEKAVATGLQVAVCTIYYPRFPNPGTQKAALTALGGFNDCILLSAIKAGIPVIDLRRVCTDITDYANPIEPSAAGGEKIAKAIARLHEHVRPGLGRTEIFV